MPRQVDLHQVTSQGFKEANEIGDLIGGIADSDALIVVLDYGTQRRRRPAGKIRRSRGECPQLLRVDLT